MCINGAAPYVPAMEHGSFSQDSSISYSFLDVQFSFVSSAAPGVLEGLLCT